MTASAPIAARLRHYVLALPARHLREERNRATLTLAALFLGVSLVLRYGFGVAPWFGPADGPGRIVLLGFAFCAFPILAGLALCAAGGAFRAPPDRRLALAVSLAIAALFLNQYGDALGLAAGAGGDPARRIAYNLRAIACYAAAPLIYRLAAGATPGEPFFGLTRRGFDRPVYLLLLALALPLVALAAQRPDFLSMYPRFAPGLQGLGRSGFPWLEFAAFETTYLLQFVALELFFRGFMVMALARWLGGGSVAVMVCAYCFIHFVKPMPEAAASVAGGYLLGVIALYTRSILGGMLVHIGIALGLELMSLRLLLQPG